MSFIEDVNVPSWRKTARRVRNGAPSNDLVFSAMQGTNDDLFPHILGLYVTPGSTVADVTYGKGVFWKNVDRKRYQLNTSDLSDGIDARRLPYMTGSIDCVVFDPPYMHTPGGSAHVGHQNFEQYYANNGTNSGSSKYHEAVLDLYFDVASEAKRVLRSGGIYIVKCQDEVCANQQRLTHVEIINHHTALGFLAEDLFVLMRVNRPGMSCVAKQVHAKKNIPILSCSGSVKGKRVGKARNESRRSPS